MSQTPGVNWDRIMTKYAGVGASLIPEDIRKDVLTLVKYARQQYQQNAVLYAELTGAKETMIALCLQSGGTIDVLYAVVDQIQPSDVLRVSDVEREGAEGPEKVKRFRVGRDVSNLLGPPN